MPPYQGNGREGWVEPREGGGRVGENEKGRVKTTTGRVGKEGGKQRGRDRWG